jgi:hypothetical protein
MALVLLAGLPSTGKSAVGNVLQNEHGIPHYDLELDPSTWPRPGLKATWERSRTEFAKCLVKEHSDAILSWGFPPPCISMVRELKASGVSIFWLAGPVATLRQWHEAAGKNVLCFDAQVAAIAASLLPAGLTEQVINVSDIGIAEVAAQVLALGGVGLR